MPLTSSFDLFQSCLLEASAGTGKTFTISHLFVRFLLAEVPLEKILVVTFTKAAVSELKGRIRGQIRETITLLTTRGECPDYLLTVDPAKALPLLEGALARFEESMIMTIHSFATKMLAKAGLFGGVVQDDEKQYEERLQALLHDTLYMGLGEQKIGDCDVKGFGAKLDSLERLLRRHLKTDKDVVHHFQSLQQQYEKASGQINELVRGQNVIAEFLRIAPYYNQIKESEGPLENLDLLAREGMSFARFIKLMASPGPFVAIREDNRNKRRKESVTSPLFNKLSEILRSLLKQSDHDALVGAVLAAVQQAKKAAYHHFTSHDDILRQMRSALKMRGFIEQIKEAFAVAIIDEFQDTDPLQWEIFAACFQDKPLFLVGDPKQSIYSFRKADVYTYLAAADSVDRKVILDTNWRSSPQLVEAFNALFSLKKWLPLPKIDDYLAAPALKAGRSADGGMVHFMVLQGIKTKAEQERHFFEAISSTIISLQEPLSSMAVLVADRGQAKRLERFLKEREIMAANWQKLHKDDDESDLAFRWLLEALLRPEEAGAVSSALMTPLLGWTRDEVLGEAFSAAREEFFALRSLWARKGFAACFTELLATTALHTGGGSSVAEKLDKTAEGRKILLETKLHVEELADMAWMRHPHLPEQLLESYDNKISSPRKGHEGVNILTTFASKGLEFGSVFALSLAFGSFQAEELFSHEDKLKVVDKEDPDYQLFLQEKDAEKLRQLYVAMTRAKKRLYLPYILSEKAAVPGKAAPLELFLETQTAGDKIAYLQELGSKASITFSFVQPQIDKTKIVDQEAVTLLLKPTNLLPAKAPERLLSFTALATKREKSRPLMQYPEGTLPSSALVGELLHEILEHLPWEKAKSPHLLEVFVAPFIKGTVLEAFGKDVADMIYKTFQLPLQGFALLDVSPDKVMREMEFLHKAEEGYLKGYIDMAFSYKGDYFLVDWKSNALEDYQEASLKAAMQESDYFLQAHIYAEAFRAYLKHFGQEERFKGIYYIFLRGPAAYYVP